MLINHRFGVTELAKQNVDEEMGHQVNEEKDAPVVDMIETLGASRTPDARIGIHNELAV